MDGLRALLINDNRLTGDVPESLTLLTNIEVTVSECWRGSSLTPKLGPALASLALLVLTLTYVPALTLGSKAGIQQV